MVSPGKGLHIGRDVYLFVFYPIIQRLNSISNLSCSKMLFLCLKMHLKQIIFIFFGKIGVFIIVIENDFVGCAAERYHLLYFF